jgi:hypothetical protein
MKWCAGFVVLALLNACCGATSSAVPEEEPWSIPTRPRSTADSSLLRFQISAEPGSGHSQTALRLSIENVSTQWLVVRRHLTLEYQDGIGSNVALEIARVSDGSRPSFVCFAKHCGGDPPEFIELAPGDQFSRRVELGCDYALPDAGPWRIVARYQDKSAGPRAPERNEHFAWFNGRLDSNAVEITVKPFEVGDTWTDDPRWRRKDEEQRVRP